MSRLPHPYIRLKEIFWREKMSHIAPPGFYISPLFKAKFIANWQITPRQTNGFFFWFNFCPD
jgi:hypothetical protein